MRIWGSSDGYVSFRPATKKREGYVLIELMHPGGLKPEEPFTLDVTWAKVSF